MGPTNDGWAHETYQSMDRETSAAWCCEMNDWTDEIRFPNGNPTDFQATAVQRLSDLLRGHGVKVDDFRLNPGAKRGFWTSFELDGQEHILTVYPDELNILAGPNLYENYLRREFESKDVLLDSFARRLTRL